MSWQPCPDPTPGNAHAADLIETVIVPRARDLGSFEVRRALPSAQRQMVGPFIFFDQMGPSEFLLGAGMDVRPHPAYRPVDRHLPVRRRDHAPRLARDRTADPPWRTQLDDCRPWHRAFRADAQELRAVGSKLFGIQSWVALSAKDEENDAGFRPL